MKYHRRDFLRMAGMAAIGGAAYGALSCYGSPDDRKEQASGNNVALAGNPVKNIRERFELDPEKIHLACLLLASHPEPVREAIEGYRKALNENPAEYVQGRYSPMQAEVRQEAAEYMGVQADEVALTDSTTMGTALLINGLQIREDQEMLTADYDYYSTHAAIEFKSARSGASYRKVPIYSDIHAVSEEEIVEKLVKEIRPNTRLVTGTWVHSATGLKIPVRKIAGRLEAINASRSPEERVLFFLDGVHGFGVENEEIGNLGCDLFSAGTHKWIFAPRGTGIIWGRSRIHTQVSPTIPTFTNGGGWGGTMTPGGFKPFEHQWAMAEAFRFHKQTGKARVQEHIHKLARQLKEGLAGMKHITLYTPMEEKLSAGIVCFDVRGMAPKTVVDRLAGKNIIASDTPYVPSYARLTPGIYNTEEEIEMALRALRELG